MLNKYALDLDMKYGDNCWIALMYVPKIRSYLAEYGEGTCQEMLQELAAEDIPLYIALHKMVHDGELLGPDPYDSAAPKTMDKMVYRFKNHHSVWDWKYQLFEMRGWLPMVGAEPAHSLGRCKECGDVTWLDAMGYCTHCIPF
jgi:hypothetical protein